MAVTRTLSSTMAMTVTGNNVNTGTPLVSTSVADNLQKTVTIALSTGTSSEQADRIYQFNETLAASGTRDLDLSGSLTDSLGQTVVFVEVTSVVLINKATVAGSDLLLGAGSNPMATLWGTAGDQIRVKAGGFLALAAKYDPAYAITAATADILRITNESGSATVEYDIIIIGRSA